jgi:hypothetical protein
MIIFSKKPWNLRKVRKRRGQIRLLKMMSFLHQLKTSRLNSPRLLILYKSMRNKRVTLMSHALEHSLMNSNQKVIHSKTLMKRQNNIDYKPSPSKNCLLENSSKMDQVSHALCSVPAELQLLLSKLGRRRWEWKIGRSELARLLLSDNAIQCRTSTTYNLRRSLKQIKLK